MPTRLFAVPVFVALLACLGLVGCAQDAFTAFDAEPALDATSEDAGIASFDAGTISGDASGPSDARAVVGADAALRSDASVSLSDASAPSDASGLTDAGTSSDAGTSADAGLVSFAQLHAQVIVPSCGCHIGGAGGLVLSTLASSYTALTTGSARTCGDRPYVLVGQPDQSYLVEKLEAMRPACGTRMPRGGSALDAASLRLVREWIQTGANP